MCRRETGTEKKKESNLSRRVAVTGRPRLCTSGEARVQRARMTDISSRACAYAWRGGMLVESEYVRRQVGRGR